MEIPVPEGISKEFAINKLLDYLHIDKKESICFGDSSSDLPMFNACNIKIAIKNGNDEIKQKATYIADDVEMIMEYIKCSNNYKSFR